MNNDGFLVTWLLGTMAVNVLHYTISLDTTFLVWNVIEDNLLQATKENLSVDENIKRLYSLCYNLAAIG